MPGIGKILRLTNAMKTGAVERFASVGDYVRNRIRSQPKIARRLHIESGFENRILRKVGRTAK